MRGAIAREPEPQGQTRGEICDLLTKMAALPGSLKQPCEAPRHQACEFSLIHSRCSLLLPRRGSTRCNIRRLYYDSGRQT